MPLITPTFIEYNLVQIYFLNSYKYNFCRAFSTFRYNFRNLITTPTIKIKYVYLI